MPFSDQYYFKRHNAKYHNGKVSTMAISYMGAKQNKDSGNVQSIKEDYTEKLLNLEKNQQRNADFIQQNTTNLLKVLEITKELASRFEAMKVYQAEEIKSKTYSCGICNGVFKNSNSLKRHKSKFHFKDDGKTGDFNLEINQPRNKDFKQKNAMHLFVAEELARGFEASKEYQAEEIKTKTYSCEKCNKIYKNSSSLRSHRSRHHTVKSTVDLNCYKCTELFTNERDLAVHNYRFHRVSL
jgi:hypothetical protein